MDLGDVMDTATQAKLDQLLTQLTDVVVRLAVIEARMTDHGAGRMDTEIRLRRVERLAYGLPTVSNVIAVASFYLAWRR